jgi:hypothetical protein
MDDRGLKRTDSLAKLLAKREVADLGACFI